MRDSMTEEEIDSAENQIHELEMELDSFRQHWNPETNRARLTAEDVAEVVGMWTGIPVTTIAEEESERLLRMEEELHKRIVGQHEAIEAISKAVRRARAGLKDPRRRSGRSSSWARPASARPSLLRRSPSSCSAARTP